MHARNCTFAHDCHKSVDFPMAGQNLATRQSTEVIKDFDKFACDSICNWFKECTLDDSKLIKLPAKGDLSKTGHFTQLARDDAKLVGCAIVGWKHDTWFKAMITCNYDLTTITNKQVYEAGSPCSSCPKGVGCSPIFKGLCRGSRLVGGTNGALLLAGVAVATLLGRRQQQPGGGGVGAVGQ